MKTRFKLRFLPFLGPTICLLLSLLIGFSAPASAAVLLHFMTLSDNVWPANVKKLVDAFEAQNPDIKIQLDTYPFRQLFETIEVRMKAQDKDVDLLCVDVPLVASYSLRGFLAPLDEYFSKDEIEKTWIKASWQAGMYKDHFMAAPMNTSTQFMFINRKLFRDAGIEPPKGLTPDQTVTYDQVAQIAVNDRWTWDQVVDAAKKLTKTENGRTEIWGFEFDQVSRLYQLQCLGDSLGATLLGPDGLTAQGYFNSPGWLKAAQWYGDLFNKWKVSPKNVAPDESPNLFASGKVAIFVGGEWNVGRFQEAGVDFLVAPIPYFAGGKPASGTGSWHMGISKNSQHKAEAAKFIRFVCADKQGTTIWFDSQGQSPATIALWNDISNDPKFHSFPKDAYLLGDYEAQHTAVPRPLTPGYLQLEDIFASTYEDIRNGVDPQSALDGAASRLDRFLAQFKK
jgi:ABC-type glycerol-3-phosphate transport system substrate-binding protein